MSDNPAPGYPYRVEGGDTLQSIARRAYSDDSQPAWQAIYTANKSIIGDDPNWIRLGLVLSIPVSPYPTMPTPGQNYSVRRGDTLQLIAQQAYGGDSRRGQRAIHKANKSVIGRNPNRILPGQVLRIPLFNE